MIIVRNKMIPTKDQSRDAQGEAIFTDKDMESLALFRARFPSWWFRIGWCDVSFDFTCAPQSRSPEAKYIKIGNMFDDGFSHDSMESLTDAILTVMSDIDYHFSVEDENDHP
jgi:hypothetical protein